MHSKSAVTDLKDYIEQHLQDDDGMWENIHSLRIWGIVNGFNKEESAEFSSAIWNWDDALLYELSQAMVSNVNPFIQSDAIYCRIVARISDTEKLCFLAENLGACFYSLHPGELDNETLRKMHTNLITVIGLTIDDHWKNDFLLLLKSIQQQLSK